MNAACVGKVVRTVFQGLSTRRLGRRGGSKYHYVNLQVVETSPFAAMRQSLGNAQKTGRKTKKHQKASASAAWSDNIKVQDEATIEETSSVVNIATARVWAKNQKKLEAVELDFVTSGLSDEERSNRNILQLTTNCLTGVHTNPDDVILIPEELFLEEKWNDLMQAVQSTDISRADIRTFLRCFRLHIGMLGGLIVRLNFHCIPNIINNFWQHQEASLQVWRSLKVDIFLKILEQEPVTSYVRKILYLMWERIFNFFFASKYNSVPDHLRAVFRDVTAKLDKWMVMATDGLPAKIRDILVSSTFGFGRTVELVLDLSSNVEHLSLLDKQKSSRTGFMSAIDSVLTHGCMMPANISQDDRQSVTTLLFKLRDLSDSRTMADAWEQFVGEHLQERSETVVLAISQESLSKTQLIRQKVLDSLGAAWMRAILELEGAVRFPGFIGSGPYHGVIRFLRDSVAFSIDCEKARIWDKSLIALNAESIAHSIPLLLTDNPQSCTHTLEHYIQCGIPIPLVNSNSLDFFRTIPELHSLLKSEIAVTDAADVPVMTNDQVIYPPGSPEMLPPTDRSTAVPSGRQEAPELAHHLEKPTKSKRSKAHRSAASSR